MWKEHGNTPEDIKRLRAERKATKLKNKINSMSADLNNYVKIYNFVNHPLFNKETHKNLIIFGLKQAIRRDKREIVRIVNFLLESDILNLMDWYSIANLKYNTKTSPYLVDELNIYFINNISNLPLEAFKLVVSSVCINDKALNEIIYNPIIIKNKVYADIFTRYMLTNHYKAVSVIKNIISVFNLDDIELVIIKEKLITDFAIDNLYILKRYDFELLDTDISYISKKIKKILSNSSYKDRDAIKNSVLNSSAPFTNLRMELYNIMEDTDFLPNHISDIFVF